MTKQYALHIASSQDRIMVTIPPGVSKAVFSGVTIRSRHTKTKGTILPIKWGRKTIKRGTYKPKGKAIYFTVETPMMVERFDAPRTVIFHNVRLEDIPK